MDRQSALLVILLCLGVAIGSISVGGQSTSDFALDSDATVTIPSQTVSNGFTDGELEVDKTAVITPDESLTGTATVPDQENKAYEIQFRDSDESLISSNETSGAETSYEFANSMESPGSYGVSILDPDEGLFKSVLPVVIASHEVDSLEINGSAPANADVQTSESVATEVSLTTLESTSIESVTLTVWNSDERQDVTLTKTADNKYEGDISPLEQGEYQTQVRIRGGETVDGRSSLIGLSEAHFLTVEQPDENSGDDGSGGGDGSEDGTDGGDGSDGTDGGDGSDGTDGGDGSEGTDGGDGSDGTGSSGDTSDDQSNETDTSDENSSDTSGDGTDPDSDTDDSSTDGETDSSSGTDGSTSGGDDDSTDGNGTADEAGEPDETIEPNEDSASSDSSEDSVPLYAVQAILITLVVGAGLRRAANSM